MHQSLKKFNAGVHLKTAGTTWLEELIGLAAAGGDGLVIAKEIYAQALSRIDELCAPYASVVKINRSALPSPKRSTHGTRRPLPPPCAHDQACKIIIQPASTPARGL